MKRVRWSHPLRAHPLTKRYGAQSIPQDTEGVFESRVRSDGETVARADLDEANRIVGLLIDDATSRATELFDTFAELAESRAEARAEEACEWTKLSSVSRTVVDLLRQRASPTSPLLEVGDHWFVTPDGRRVDLHRHASLRRMLHALVDRAETHTAIDVRELFEAGWPGERITAGSARNRVHVNLAKLRCMGLRSLIERTESGYRLDPTVPIRRVGADVVS